ncbi:MAG: peptidoglycan-associated lipoprotein Pal [Candidatus Omnitrophica bacterium]|nr:peptidoglycan-associated lipoprotein Pal [Candidatus Omnitrophota bacterium]
MKKVLVVASLCIIISIIVSGCCPYSKKKTPPKETPLVSQPSSTDQKISQPLAQKPHEEPVKKPSTDTSTATPTEITVATTGGEIPPVKTEDEPKFIKPEEKGVEEIFQPIYFDFDKYNIKTSEHAKLRAIADYLKKNPDISILIEGHCDERGTDEYNLVLGEKRALSTRNFLIGLGISPKRLYTISYGESMPADPGHNEEAWAKNRRCEFKIKQ